MKTLMRLALAVGTATLISGCVVSVGSDTSPRSRHEVPKPPPIVVPAATPDDAGVLAEIDAATKLNFDPSKLQVLKNVAARSGLSPACQVHLVNTGLRTLDFDPSRVDLLMVLIGNPGFSPQAKEAILRQIELLDHEPSRRQVIGAIQDRSTTP